MLVGEVWDGSRLAAWTSQSAPDDVSGPRCREVVVDGKTWIELGCFDSDVYPLTPNSNPRAQLVSPELIVSPEGYNLTLTLHVPPTSLPDSWANDGYHWVELVQPFYGPPWAGSPPVRLVTMDGLRLGVREADGPIRWATDALAPQWRGIDWQFSFSWNQRTAAAGGGYGVRAGRAGGPLNVVIPWRSYDCVRSSNNGGPNRVYLDAYMAAALGAQNIGPVRFADVKLTRLS